MSESNPTRSLAGIDIVVANSFEAPGIERDAWDACVVSTGGDVFLSYDWCRCWWETYGAGRELAICVFREGERLVGLLPLFIERVRIGPVALRLARLVGSDSTLGICDPPLASEQARLALELVVDTLLGGEACDGLALGPVRGACAAGIALRDLAAVRSDLWLCRDLEVMPHTEFPLPETFDIYLKSIYRKDRQAFRRRVRRLEDAHRIHMETLQEGESAEDAFEDFLRLHETQWRRADKGGHFIDRPEAARFHRAVARAQARLGRLRLLRMIADGEPIAYRYGFKFGARHTSLLTARAVESKWEPYGLGRMTFFRTIEDAIGEGVVSIEAGRGHYDHKLRMGGEEKPLISMLVLRNSARVRFRGRLFALLSSWVDLVYYRLWFSRISPRLGLPPRALWRGWIRSRL